MGWMTEELEFDLWHRQKIIPFSKLLRSSKPVVQWVMGSISLAVKRPGHEPDH
jgi:hypothetical protein